MADDVVLLFRIVVVYSVCAAAVVLVFRDDPLAELLRGWSGAVARFDFNILDSFWLILPITFALFLTQRGQVLKRLVSCIPLVFLCLWLMAVFLIVKVTLPHILPYFADPFLERLDRALHLGRQPLELTHQLSGYIDPDLIVDLYAKAWYFPASLLPVIVFLVDPDWARRRRYILLYAATWILLGNVGALLLMSAGPVYYADLFGTGAFDSLPQLMVDSGIDQTMVPDLQEYLWQLYIFGQDSSSTGISAFPSVHVAMITVFGLYLVERQRAMVWLVVPLIVFFQFASVYLGWHYAIDGYFSILFVVGLWMWTRPKRLPADAGEANPAFGLTDDETGPNQAQV